MYLNCFINIYFLISINQCLDQKNFLLQRMPLMHRLGCPRYQEQVSVVCSIGHSYTPPELRKHSEKGHRRNGEQNNQSIAAKFQFMNMIWLITQNLQQLQLPTNSLHNMTQQTFSHRQKRGWQFFALCSYGQHWRVTRGKVAIVFRDAVIAMLFILLQVHLQLT